MDVQYQRRTHVSVNLLARVWLAISSSPHRLAYPPSSNILLAMITTRKSIFEFPLLSYMGIRLSLVAIQAAGAPL